MDAFLTQTNAVSIQHIQAYFQSFDIDKDCKMIGAVIVTVALFLNWRAHTEKTTYEMIDRAYSVCHSMQANLFKEWQLNHLYAIGKSDYEIAKSRIVKGLGDTLNAEMKEQLLVKERLFTAQILVAYEQILYQFNNSSKLFHRKRHRFLKDMLSYFEDRLLINPRLLWFIDQDKSGEGIHLELATRNRLQTKLKLDTNKKSHKQPFDFDPNGPFV